MWLKVTVNSQTPKLELVMDWATAKPQYFDKELHLPNRYGIMLLQQKFQ